MGDGIYSVLGPLVGLVLLWALVSWSRRTFGPGGFSNLYWPSIPPPPIEPEPDPVSDDQRDP